MSKLELNITMSIDGFVAGPDHPVHVDEAAACHEPARPCVARRIVDVEPQLLAHLRRVAPDLVGTLASQPSRLRLGQAELVLPDRETSDLSEVAHVRRGYTRAQLTSIAATSSASCGCARSQSQPRSVTIHMQ